MRHVLFFSRIFFRDLIPSYLGSRQRRAAALRDELALKLDWTLNNMTALAPCTSAYTSPVIVIPDSFYWFYTRLFSGSCWGTVCIMQIRVKHASGWTQAGKIGELCTTSPARIHQHHTTHELPGSPTTNMLSFTVTLHIRSICSHISVSEPK